MRKQINKLHILGKVSTVVSKKLPNYYDSVNEHTIWLFVGYSFTEYKIGDSFDIFIKESDQTWNHDYELKLQRVFDEFGRSYTNIPEGYKTICLFDCSPSIPAYIKNLPTLKTWDVNDSSLYLCNHANIDLLQDSLYDSVIFDAYSKMVLFTLSKKNKKYFTMQDIFGIIPKDTPQLIIDNLFLSGALKRTKDELICV